MKGNGGWSRREKDTLYRRGAVIAGGRVQRNTNIPLRNNLARSNVWRSYQWALGSVLLLLSFLEVLRDGTWPAYVAVEQPGTGCRRSPDALQQLLLAWSAPLAGAWRGRGALLPDASPGAAQPAAANALRRRGGSSNFPHCGTKPGCSSFCLLHVPHLQGRRFWPLMLINSANSGVMS